MSDGWELKGNGYFTKHKVLNTKRGERMRRETQMDWIKQQKARRTKERLVQPYREILESASFVEVSPAKQKQIVLDMIYKIKTTELQNMRSLKRKILGFVEDSGLKS